MTWTCDQVEARLSDYLDGLLREPERAEFDTHVKSCAECGPLLASVHDLVTELHGLEPVEASPRLVYSILDKTLGPRESVTGWQGFWNFVRGMGSPKFAYGAASVMATFVILVGASGVSLKKPKLADLRPATVVRNLDRQGHLVYARAVKSVSDWRVVYEIQSRLRQDPNQLQSTPDQSLPKTAPEKDPGQTDEHKPGQPRQQNRANEVSRQLEVMAAWFPVMHERSLR
jgi:anti-sigma factor RsiW